MLNCWLFAVLNQVMHPASFSWLVLKVLYHAKMNFFFFFCLDFYNVIKSTFIINIELVFCFGRSCFSNAAYSVRLPQHLKRQPTLCCTSQGDVCDVTLFYSHDTLTKTCDHRCTKGENVPSSGLKYNYIV